MYTGEIVLPSTTTRAQKGAKPCPGLISDTLKLLFKIKKNTLEGHLTFDMHWFGNFALEDHNKVLIKRLKNLKYFLEHISETQ